MPQLTQLFILPHLLEIDMFISVVMVIFISVLMIVVGWRSGFVRAEHFYSTYREESLYLL